MIKNLFKCILVFVVIISSSLFVYEVNANVISSRHVVPKAWPGRPGGNGDGSEEWLHGKYGEPSGPFILISQSQGRISDLNDMNNRVNTIGGAIFTSLGLFLGVASTVLSGAITIAGIASAFNGSYYKGNYYKSETYVSGRCMKTIITTYEDRNYTEYIKTYTRWMKW